MIRVIVVDDSSFMRQLLTRVLTSDPEIRVVATANDGREALAKVWEHEADVMTLDLEMPRLDGLQTLQELMRTKPMPVLMVSSHTRAGSEPALKALESGALDYILVNHNSDLNNFGEELCGKVRALSRKKGITKLKYNRLHNIKTTPLPRPDYSSLVADYVQTPLKGPRDLVVIGVSTGGPPTVEKIFAALPANLAACVLVAQHMPASFTGAYAKRLDNACPLRVSEAADGDRLINGHVYICPGGKHIGIRMRGALPEIFVSDEPRSALFKPSVDVLMESAGNCMGRRTLGVMLTGMGTDGCKGARVLKQKGGGLIAQSEATCVVFGMPKAVIAAKLADQILDADQIAEAIAKTVRGYCEVRKY